MSVAAESPIEGLSSRPGPLASTSVPRPERKRLDRPSLPFTPTTPGGPSVATPPGVTPRTTSSACDASTCTRMRSATGEPLLPEAQRRWAARPVTERLLPIRLARHWIAAHPQLFAKVIDPGLARAEADTLAAEVLPLLDAMRFLERNARELLSARKLGVRHRPLWLAGVQAEIHRDPLGHILVIGPANFPLFLPGVQTLGALVAGNAVTWKPGSGGEKVAVLLAHALLEAGLPRGILHITDDSVDAAQIALAHHPDKVVFTGSYPTGRGILRKLAETATPAVMELSGADAVVILPSADLTLAARAIGFGLRLNGAEVCMSPRRVITTRETLRAFKPILSAELAKLPASPVANRTAQTVQALLIDALSEGAELLEVPLSPEGTSHLQTPESTPGQQPSPAADDSAETTQLRAIVLNHATPGMAITRTDLFAPVLSLIEAPSVLGIPDLVNDNPYGLTAAVFGAPSEANSLAAQLRVGTVVINDLIAPTADPRTPFGGRGRSGFGLTRGAEGLLEMTAVKTVLRRRRKGLTRHYNPLGAKDLPLFAGLIGVLHAGGLRARLRSLKLLLTAARNR